MALQAGVDVVQGIQTLMNGIVEAGGAAGQAFFNHQIVVTQMLLQQPGPALLFGEADAAVQTVTGIGAVAVSIGVAQTYNVLFHKKILPD